jgi:hypothetical protein
VARACGVWLRVEDGLVEVQFRRRHRGVRCDEGSLVGFPSGVEFGLTGAEFVGTELCVLYRQVRGHVGAVRVDHRLHGEDLEGLAVIGIGAGATKPVPHEDGIQDGQLRNGSTNIEWLGCRSG